MQLTYKPPRLISCTAVAPFASEIISIFTVNTTLSLIKLYYFPYRPTFGTNLWKIEKEDKLFSLDVPEDSTPVLL